MNNLTTKRKRTAGGTLQQSQMNDGQRAATPTQTQGEFTSSPAELQQKMKVAAEKLVQKWLTPMTGPYRSIELFVFCTPENVFFKLNGGWEWVRITKENIEAAVIESKLCDTDYWRALGWSQSRITRLCLFSIGRVCAESKRFSCVLPRISKREGGALV